MSFSYLGYVHLSRLVRHVFFYPNVIMTSYYACYLQLFTVFRFAETHYHGNVC